MAEVVYLVRDLLFTSKIRETVGWTPSHAFEQALEETVAWYREHGAWLDHVRSGEYRAYYRKMYGTRGE